MIEEMLEELKQLEDEQEVADAIVELGTAIRQVEIEYVLAVGEILQRKNEIIIQKLSGKSKKFFERAKLLYQYWNEVQAIYTKEKNLTDLLNYIRYEILKEPKKERKKDDIRAVLEERYNLNHDKYQQEGDYIALAKAEEDKELLEVINEKKKKG